MVGIYKITNPNGKVYIGQAINIDKRIQKYKWISAIQKQPKIKRSIDKHGWENHTVDILEECSVEQLDNREAFHKQQFIDMFGWKNALFCKIHDCVKDRCLPQEIKDRIGKSNTGKKRTTEQKAYLTQIRTRGKHCKPAYQYDLEGNFIKEWKYREDAEVFYNGHNTSSNITQCIKGKQKAAYGFQWTSVYSENILPYTPHLNYITQYTLDGKEIKQWNNISEAEKHYNPNSFKLRKYGSNNIRACLNGGQKTAYGFIWRY